MQHEGLDLCACSRIIQNVCLFQNYLKQPSMPNNTASCILSASPLTDLSLHCLVPQRVLLLSYDKASRRVHLRHYSISAQPSGVSKSVKALVTHRAVPDMGHVQDVSELLSKSGYGSVRAALLCVLPFF